VSEEPEQLSFESAPAGPREENGQHAPPDSTTEAIPSPFPPTPEQAAAIDGRDRDIFLEAGAGTGKTRVLVDRYCDAVDLDGVEPERILAFTFTEKAAAEMRRRVRVELMRRARAAGDGERRSRLTRAARAGEGAPITTIHGFCRRLLGAHPVAAGLDPRFRVLDADEATRLAGIAFATALEACAASDDDVARVAAGYRFRLAGLIRGAHSELRNQGRRHPRLPPLQITAFEGRGEEPPDEGEIALADSSYRALGRLLERFGEEYEAVKQQRSGVDFDDLQLIALELLDRNRGLAEGYRERFDHLLVDEFQDTSPLQVGLVRALRGPSTRLFVVGDEFQSIYAFRGADLESFRKERERMRERGGPGSVLPLTGSFRSTPEVVAAVNAIGRCLLEDFRELKVGREAGGDGDAGGPDPTEPTVELLLTERAGWKDDGIEIRTGATETEPNRIAEARVLARRLRELADSGVPRRSMVLLLRAFSHVDAYAEALELAGLNPYVVGGRGYWSSQQVEDALRLLACVANPLDDEALFGALASPACGASPDALWILRRAAGRRNQVWPAVESHLLGLHDPPDADQDPEEAERFAAGGEWAAKLPDADRERLVRFAGRLRELRAGAAQLPLDALVERTMECFDYDLAALALPGGRRRAANLLKLIRLAAEFESHEGRDLRGFLTYAADRAAASDREAEATIAAEDHDGVTVMTVHAAKGLEFGCVAVGDLGRGMTNPGAPSELRLAFGSESADPGEAEGGDGDGEPRVGLRLARAGAGALTLHGYKEINDTAALADSREAGQLAYVAASRARERLVLSGLFDPVDLEGGPDEFKPKHSVLARLLPALGIEEDSDGEPVPMEAPAPRDGLDLEAADARARVGIFRASPELAAELAYELDVGELEPEPEPGGRPPMLALAERGSSAARNLSYAALADYSRCGYRFLTERVLGLGFDAEAAGPMEPDAAEEPSAVIDFDEEPEAPPGTGDDGPSPAESAAFRHSRLGFGRAVHELLELSAREDWREPGPEEVEAALGREGGDPGDAARALAMVQAWLTSPLLAELREAGARFRPELAFRISLGAGTVLRGTIDLLAEVPGRPPLVIDYKTDSVAPDGEQLAPGYEIQRSLYAHAIAEALGVDSVGSAYVFLARAGSPLLRELDAEEITAGRERIEALTERIRERSFPVTDRPHAALCHDCPARARLCPHPRELTLAPRPPASPVPAPAAAQPTGI